MVTKKEPAAPCARTAAELAERLRVVADAVPEFRRRGVTKLRLADMEIEIDPQPSELPPRQRADDLPDDFLDPNKYRPREEDRPADDDGGRS